MLIAVRTHWHLYCSEIYGWQYMWLWTIRQFGYDN